MTLSGILRIAPFLWQITRYETRRPRSLLSVRDRLAMLPIKGFPVRGRTLIHWNEHQVPFIEASEDEDLAAALGLVHAHLRLGQMEMLRRLSQGRVAEMIGPLGIELDRTMRTLSFGRAVPEMVAAMPAETRGWLEAFLSGLNHYLAHAPALPPEFEILGLSREAWGLVDILTLARLVSIDVNWLVWFRLLKYRNDRDWPALWRRICTHDLLSRGSGERGADPGGPILSALEGSGTRTGSNAFVVAGGRSASGAPLIGADPHLPLILPSPWLICGLSSPSCNAVGLMVPGLPVIALGRNRWIAWGGTNLHAASSDLVSVPETATGELRERTETIVVRWRRPSTVVIRESPWGPVVTDLPWLGSRREMLALRWMGHRPSDEITSMLRVNRARSWTEFRSALEGFALPGQRMLYADAEGHIGDLLAVHLPRREAQVPADLPVPPGPEAMQAGPATSRDFPHRLDPPEGFIASANERPGHTVCPIGYHFSPPHRKRRLEELLRNRETLSLDDVARIQQDVHCSAAVAQRDRLLAWWNEASPGSGGDHRLMTALATWTGDYTAASRGALAFELVLYHLARRLVPRRRREAYAASWGTRLLIWEDILAAQAELRAPALRQALRDAARRPPRDADWGKHHRLRLAHPLGLAPLVGRFFRFVDLPTGGSSETVHKSAHLMTDRIHAASYGSGARHISDLSDPDRNSFVLAGGQDGWLGSTTFRDQVSLWQRGEYMEIPLRTETVRRTFPHRTELAP